MTMKNNNMNGSNDRSPYEPEGRPAINWSKPKEEVWSSMMQKIGESEPVVRQLLPRRRLLYAAAAVVVLLAGVASVMKFYSRTVVAGSGEQLAYNLPDNSTVTLNAGTEISFNPLWWRFSRELNMEGEAFFEVEKGSTFTVRSPLASTEVVGTSFNIFARGSRYEVTCVTGKVRVFTGDEEGVIIEPDQVAQLDSDGKIVHSTLLKAESQVAWKDGEFYFTAYPLSLVFEEIERQFDIEIIAKGADTLYYTGNFSRKKMALPSATHTGEVTTRTVELETEV